MKESGIIVRAYAFQGFWRVALTFLEAQVGHPSKDQYPVNDVGADVLSSRAVQKNTWLFGHPGMLRPLLETGNETLRLWSSSRPEAEGIELFAKVTATLFPDCEIMTVFDFAMDASGVHVGAFGLASVISVQVPSMEGGAVSLWPYLSTTMSIGMGAPTRHKYARPNLTNFCRNMSHLIGARLVSVSRLCFA
jgi:hypothetical protein